MPEALAVVKVGNSAWLFRRLTPSRAIAVIVGAVVSSTKRERSPSAMNNTTLCGCEAGVCAKAPAPATICRNTVPTKRVRRMRKLQLEDQVRRIIEWEHVLNGAHDSSVTGG